MFNLPLSVVIEGLVAILLVITIGYCILLNSRLKRLRADEEGLRATIGELLTATEIAERAIQGLRTTSAQCDQAIGQRLKEAAHVSDQLSAKLNAAGAVAQRVGNAPAGGAQKVQAQAARAVKAVPAPAQPHSAPAAPTDSPSRRLDDAARALQERLQKVAS